MLGLATFVYWSNVPEPVRVKLPWGHRKTSESMCSFTERTTLAGRTELSATILVADPVPSLSIDHQEQASIYPFALA